MSIHLNLNKSAVAIIVLLLLCQLPVIAAFRFRRNVNFEYCWNTTVQYLNTTEYDDKRQYFPWDRTHSYRLNLSQSLLSLFGCESLCHDGFELWSADDTVSRVVMWVLPACVLLVHFHFAPLGIGNQIAVIVHLLGDPLDTLWSMMTRQEVNRRLHRRANRFSELSTDFKHVATVWSAYDELGWSNPSAWFADALRKRNPEWRNSLTAPNKRSLARQNTRWLFQSWKRLEAGDVSGRSSDAEAKFQETDIRGPESAELYYIQLASHRLASNRSESQLTTWFAIFGLLGALCAAFIRTYTQRLNNQTSHTIAVVTLFFILIPIIKISGNIGSFTSTSIAMDIIQELQRSLRNLKPDRSPLFPPVEFDYDTFPWDYSRPSKSAQADHELQPMRNSAEITPGAPSPPPGPSPGTPDPTETSEYKSLQMWPKMAPWAGMNSSWRPCKKFLIVDHSSTEDRSRAMLFFFSLLFVMCAYSPALILSYLTPTVGFGCRSMAWTFILILWLCSAALDQALKISIVLAEKLWAWTLVKDSTVVFLFVGTIVTAQIGLFNSCWCRSAVLELHANAHLGLGPQSRGEWLAGWPSWLGAPLGFLSLIGLILLWVGQDGGRASALLSRDESERQSDLLLLNKARGRLQPELLCVGCNAVKDEGNGEGLEEEARKREVANGSQDQAQAQHDAQHDDQNDAQNENEGIEEENKIDKVISNYSVFIR